MPVLTTDGLHQLSVLALAAVTLVATPVSSVAADVWRADRSISRADLPTPREHAIIKAGSISCSEQRWTLTFELKEAVEPTKTKVSLRVDETSFATTADVEGRVVTLRVDRSMLEPIMAGHRLGIDFADKFEEAIGDIEVPLRGSRRAIRAMETTCSHRDMSAYETVSFAGDRKGIDLGTQLRKADIEAFNYATTARPKVEAARIELGEDRQIVFARLCGSWWYYGASGCNISGFSEFPAELPPEAAEESPSEAKVITEPQPVWKVIFDSENARLYLDKNAVTDGWPDIVSIPTRADDGGKIWRWSGTRYTYHGTFGDDDADEETAEEIVAEPKASEVEPAQLEPETTVPDAPAAEPEVKAAPESEATPRASPEMAPETAPEAQAVPAPSAETIEAE